MKEQMKKQMRQRHREAGFVVITLETTGPLFWGYTAVNHLSLPPAPDELYAISTMLFGVN